MPGTDGWLERGRGSPYSAVSPARYWNSCGEGNGLPPRMDDPLDPVLESGRCKSKSVKLVK